MEPQIIIVSEEEYDWIKEWMEQPARSCPSLAKLFREEGPFEYAGSEDQTGTGATQV